MGHIGKVPEKKVSRYEDYLKFSITIKPHIAEDAPPLPPLFTNLYLLREVLYFLG